MPVADYVSAFALPLQPGIPIESARMSLSSESQQQFSSFIDALTRTRESLREWREFVSQSVTLGLPIEPFSIGALWTQDMPISSVFLQPSSDAYSAFETQLIRAIRFSQPSPASDLNEQAKASLREYARFYSELADVYAEMLRQSGRDSDAKLVYARNRGMAHLAELAERVNPRTAKQFEQLNKVLTGHRQIAESTTDVGGRGALLVRFPDDLARRLERWRLLRALPQQPALDVKVAASITRAPALAA